jgi:hypothetical protein
MYVAPLVTVHAPQPQPAPSAAARRKNVLEKQASGGQRQQYEQRYQVYDKVDRL